MARIERGSQSNKPSSWSASYKTARDRLLRRFEERYLERLLARTNGNVSQAAREAKMDRSHLTDLINRHNVAK
jgi:DNA-binding NtrC family response regulator